MCINTLAGVPSIVFGLFGLAFFVLFLFPLLGFEPKPCILAASMTLAVLILPVMIRASEEAIRAVPRPTRKASLALGASRFHTFMTVTLPAALPGILTGIILSLSRVAGETAPILFTGAVAMGDVPRSVFDPTRTLSYGSYDMAVGDRLAMMVPHNQYGMVMTLVLLILILNVAGHRDANPRVQESSEDNEPQCRAMDHAECRQQSDIADVSRRHQIAVPRTTIARKRNEDAARPPYRRARAADHPVEGLQPLLRLEGRRQEHHDGHLPVLRHGHHRPQRLRQEHLPAKHQPHERPDPRTSAPRAASK